MLEIVMVVLAVISPIGVLAWMVRKIVANFEPDNRNNTVARDVIAAVALSVGPLVAALSAGLGPVVALLVAWLLSALVFKFAFEMSFGLSLGCSVLLALLNLLIALGASLGLAFLAAVHPALAVVGALAVAAAPIAMLARDAGLQRRREMYGY